MAKKNKKEFHMTVITCNYEDILDKFGCNLKAWQLVGFLIYH